MSLTPEQMKRTSLVMQEAGCFDMTNEQLISWVQARIDELKSRKSEQSLLAIPPGFLYMVTVTQHSSKSESDMMSLWEHKVIPFVESQRSKILLASMERAGAFHVHFLLQMPKYGKNLKRDLCKAVDGNIVDVGRKITNGKLFNGACKYITKEGYDEDTTHVKMLVSQVQKVEGQGWILKI